VRNASSVSSSRHATTNGRPRRAISGSSCLTRFYGINTRVWYYQQKVSSDGA